ILGIGCDLGRIPSGGWILKRFELLTAFSPAAKERLGDEQVPLRKAGRVQAAHGDYDSRVVVFGQAVGADILGRPLYTNWYFPKLQSLVLTPTSLEEAASALASLNVSHVIFDLRNWRSEWKPWHEAVQKY